MEKLALCRICLMDNVRMHVVADSHLQQIFEKLTNIPFITEDRRPMLACFFCYARLKQCYKFKQKCLEAEAVFIQMLDEEYEHLPIQAEFEFYGGFLKTPIEQFSIEDRHQEDERQDKQDIKEELTGDCERIENVEIKAEHQINASEQESNHFEDNQETNKTIRAMRIVFQSDSEDGIPTTRMKTGVEQVKKKRKATTKEREARKKSAPVAKKQKLRKDSKKNKKNEQANSKVIDRTKSIEHTQSNSTTKTVFKKCIINSENVPMCTNLSNNSNNDDLKSNDGGINIDVLKKHGSNHSNLSTENLHKCDVCHRSFINKRSLKLHIRIHTNEYKCDICQRSFTQIFALKRHLRVHTGEKPYKCDICQSSFAEKHHLIFHIYKHTGKNRYKCDICPSRFIDQRNFKRHIRIHTCEKPYKCDICQSTFIQKVNLKSHIRIHTGKRPYKCNLCQRSFNLKGDLNRHIRVHTGEKLFECDVCQKSFALKSNLKTHIRVHTGEKPYKCHLCQSSFKQKDALKRHIRVHTGEKPYKCDVCQRSFINPSHLKRHSFTHC